MNKKIYSAPLSVCWDLTYKCNLKCIHCCFGNLNSLSNIEHENISLKESYALIDELDKMGITVLEFAGGEPLIHKNFSEIYNYAATKKFKISLVTNGILLSEKLLDMFKRNHIARIQISLDGFNKELHEFIRGKNTFYKTISKICLVIEKEISLIVATVVHKKNYLYLSEFATFLVNLGVKCFRIQFLLNLGNAKDNNDDLMIDNNEQIIAIKKLYENTYVKEGKIKIILPCSYESMINEKKLITHSKSFYSNECGAGTLHANINPYGDVTACALLVDKKWIEGNIHFNHFADIWRNPQGFKTWRNDYELSGKCMECELYSDCHMGCRAMGFLKYDEDELANKALCWGKRNEMVSV